MTLYQQEGIGYTRMQSLLVLPAQLRSEASLFPFLPHHQQTVLLNKGLAVNSANAKSLLSSGAVTSFPQVIPS